MGVLQAVTLYLLAPFAVEMQLLDNLPHIYRSGGNDMGSLFYQFLETLIDQRFLIGHRISWEILKSYSLNLKNLSLLTALLFNEFSPLGTRHIWRDQDLLFLEIDFYQGC